MITIHPCLQDYVDDCTVITYVPILFRSPIWLTYLILIFKWILMWYQDFLMFVIRHGLQNTYAEEYLCRRIQFLFTTWLALLKTKSSHPPMDVQFSGICGICHKEVCVTPFYFFALFVWEFLGIMSYIVIYTTIDFTWLSHSCHFLVWMILCCLQKYTPTFI